MLDQSAGLQALGLNVPTPTSDGHWISTRVHQIVELIKDYDPNIEVQWIPPDQRLANDPQFRLVDSSPGRPPYVMFYVQDVREFDERVLARVIRSDSAKSGLILSEIDAHNDAAKLVKAKEKADESEEKADLVMHILKSPKARYRHNGVVYE